jgi:hypothetical protein
MARSKVFCSLKHRMVPILGPDLLLCECSSYGRLSHMKGAVADARALIEKQGGIEQLRHALEVKEQRAKRTREKDRREEEERRQAAIKRDVIPSVTDGDDDE